MGALIAGAAALAPLVSKAISLAAVFGGGPPSDPLEKVTDSVGPEHINAHAQNADGSGYWVDNDTQAILSHAEASGRQHKYMAALLNAHTQNADGTGWWIDNATGHQLTHDEAWRKWQAFGGTIPGTVQSNVQQYVETQVAAAKKAADLAAQNITSTAVAGLKGAATGATAAVNTEIQRQQLAQNKTILYIGLALAVGVAVWAFVPRRSA